MTERFLGVTADFTAAHVAKAQGPSFAVACSELPSPAQEKVGNS